MQVDIAPELRVLGEQARLVTRTPGFDETVPVPGAGRFAEASSTTSTQSFESGAVKLCDPLFGNVPINVAAEVCGSYHHALAVELEDVIFAMFIVLAVPFPSEK
jgi:hypothetical protein